MESRPHGGPPPAGEKTEEKSRPSGGNYPDTGGVSGSLGPGQATASIKYSGPRGKLRGDHDVALSAAVGAVSVTPQIDDKGKITGEGSIQSGYGNDGGGGFLKGKRTEDSLKFALKVGKQLVSFVSQMRDGNNFVGTLNVRLPPAKVTLFPFVVPDFVRLPLSPPTLKQPAAVYHLTGVDGLDNREIEEIKWGTFGGRIISPDDLVGVQVEATADDEEIGLWVFYTDPRSGTAVFLTKTITVEQVEDHKTLLLLSARRTTVVSGEEFLILYVEGIPSRGSGSKLVFSWNFGDNNTDAVGRKEAQSVSDQEFELRHSYEKPGSYTACVEVLDEAGDTDESCVDVTVLQDGLLEVSLSGPDTLPNFSATGDFFAETSGGLPPYAFFWSRHPSKELPASNGQQFFFEEPGSYLVQVRVKDQTETLKRRLSVIVRGADPLTVGLGRVPETPVPPGDRVALDVDLSGGIRVVGGVVNGYRVKLDWKDGKPDVEENVGKTNRYGEQVNIVMSHVYREPGTYTVVATVTDVTGREETTSAEIVVERPPDPDLLLVAKGDPIPRPTDAQVCVPDGTGSATLTLTDLVFPQVIRKGDLVTVRFTTNWSFAGENVREGSPFLRDSVTYIVDLVDETDRNPGSRDWEITFPADDLDLGNPILEPTIKVQTDVFFFCEGFTTQNHSNGFRTTQVYEKPAD